MSIKNRFLKRCIATVLPLLMLASLSTQSVAQDTQGPSLYERLGGYDAISAVVDDFADRLFADPVIGSRFTRGMGTETRMLFRQKNTNMVCFLTGGPCQIISRAPEAVHQGLNITQEEFDILMGHFADTLDAFDVPEDEQRELTAIYEGFRTKIVDRENQ
jgi:hemoglobin